MFVLLLILSLSLRTRYYLYYWYLVLHYCINVVIIFTIIFAIMILLSVLSIESPLINNIESFPEESFHRDIFVFEWWD